MKLSSKESKGLPKSDFAEPGKRAYPIENKSHAANAKEKMPLAEKDFLSAVEGNLRGHDPKQCTHWGLSVWLTEEAAEHGRRLATYMRKWHVARGIVVNDDGVLLHTPSNEQADHYTFWKCVDVSIANKFQIVMQPLLPEPQ